MTNSTLHLVIAVVGGTPELVAGPFTWRVAQERYTLLEANRKASGASLSTLYYAVRSMDDPRYAHLAPRLYPDLPSAAKALARRVAPGQSSRSQHRMLWLILAGTAERQRGWWHTAARARQLGYLASVSGEHVAYITALAPTLYQEV